MSRPINILNNSIIIPLHSYLMKPKSTDKYGLKVFHATICSSVIDYQYTVVTKNRGHYLWTSDWQTTLRSVWGALTQTLLITLSANARNIALENPTSLCGLKLMATNDAKHTALPLSEAPLLARQAKLYICCYKYLGNFTASPMTANDLHGWLLENDTQIIVKPYSRHAHTIHNGANGMDITQQTICTPFYRYLQQHCF